MKLVRDMAGAVSALFRLLDRVYIAVSTGSGSASRCKYCLKACKICRIENLIVKTCYTSLKGVCIMRFLFIIAILFIALALCNRYSPQDAKLLRTIIKVVLIFFGIILVICILILVLLIMSPLILRSLFEGVLSSY